MSAILNATEYGMLLARNNPEDRARLADHHGALAKQCPAREWTPTVVDMPDAQDVEVLLDATGKLWVNVDGKCALRIGHCRLVQMDDPSRGVDVVWNEESAEEGAG